MNQQNVKSTCVNHKIRASKVLVIGEDGKNLGEMSIKDALNKAANADLDLVEVSSGKTVPVCKVMDFGKWKYKQSKRLKKNKNHTQRQVVKEIKFRPNTGDNDLKYRAKNAVKFLSAGHKVKLSVRFKGREMEHMYDTGKSLLERFLDLVDCDYNIDGNALAEGNCIALVISAEKKDTSGNNN
jgi:translation initiation factor IF-3